MFSLRHNGGVHPLPVTPAQRDRVSRIVAIANDMLSTGGEAALQMKALAARADVSLATLYRYFPSKDLLLVALGVYRYESALARIGAGMRTQGATPGERLASLLLREFGVARREPAVAAALTRVGIHGDPELRGAMQAMQRLHLEMATLAAVGDGPALTAEAAALIPLALSAFSDGARAWLSGTRSAETVRLEVARAALLLDLPAAEAAAIDSAARRAAGSV